MSDPLGEQAAREQTLISRRALEIGAAGLTLAFGLAIMMGAREFSTGWSDRGPEPGYFPFWIGLVVCLGSLVTLVQAFLSRDTTNEVALTTGQATRALSFLVPMVGFVALTHGFGIYAASVLYLFGVMTVQGRYSLALSACVALATAVSLYFLFDKWLKVPLAKGPLEAWLGIH